MASPYPFRGAVRWAVLPALIVAAGALVAMLEDNFTDRPLGGAVAAAIGAAFVFPVGAAMAVGRRPLVALLVAFALGALSLYAGAAVITNLLGLRASFDAGLWNMAALGGTAAVGVVSHLFYLRVRRWEAGLFYILASMGGAALASVLDERWNAVDLLRRGVAGGLLQGAALWLALRTAERAGRATSGETPPARDV